MVGLHQKIFFKFFFNKGSFKKNAHKKNKSKLFTLKIGESEQFRTKKKKQKHKIKNKKAKHNWNKNPTENQDTKKNKSCSFKLPKQKPKFNNKINNLKRKQIDLLQFKWVKLECSNSYVQ